MFLCLIAALLLTACGSGSSEEGLLLSAESGVLQDKASGTKDSGTGDLKESSGQVSSESKTASGQTTSGSKAASGEIYVYVCGEVKKPGVYALRPESRVYEAVELAGGFTKQAAQDSLNMAEPLSDGQMVRIASKQETQPAAGGQSSPGGIGGSTGAEAGTGTAAGDSEKVNLNTADADQLQTLSGIGESKALAILAYREENGSFSKPEDLMNVPGIKEGTYTKIKDQIIV